jgi:hypothetical protein
MQLLLSDRKPGFNTRRRRLFEQSSTASAASLRSPDNSAGNGARIS